MRSVFLVKYPGRVFKIVVAESLKEAEEVSFLGDNYKALSVERIGTDKNGVVITGEY